MMKKIFRFLLVTSLFTSANLALAAGPEDNFAQIKKNLTNNLPDLVIDQIRTTPFAGVYEIDSGRKVFYVDASGNYALIGNLLDLTKKVSLTEQRTQDLNQIDWDKLPLNLAIKRTIGRGSNRIAVFTDPDCPFCQRLETETLPQLSDVTIYYFLFPLSIHANANIDSKKILCAENPESAIVSYMSKGMPLGKNSSCRNAEKLAKMVDIGNNLVQVTGTPTIVLPNGRLISGLVPSDYLSRMISTNSAESKPVTSAQ